MTKKPIRLGILCNSNKLPLWLQKALGSLVLCGVLDLCLIAVQTPGKESLLDRTGSFVKEFLEGRHNWIYWIYLALDRYMHRTRPDAHFERKCDDIPSTPVLELMDSEITHSRIRLGKMDLGALVSHNLDVLLCYDLIPEGFEDQPPATFGVWILELDSLSKPPDICDIFWRTIERVPVAGFKITQMAYPKNRILCGSAMPTGLPEDCISVNLAYNRFSWVVSAWISILFKNLYLSGSAILPGFQEEQNMEPVLVSTPPPPDNIKMIRLIARRCLQRSIAMVTSVSGYDQWNIAYKLDDTVEDLLGVCQFRTMTPPKDRFWADPFPVKFKDRYFIFIEEFIYSKKKGHISVIEIDSDGRWTEPVKILERDYHLSYPGVFLWEGCYYMMPESGKNRTIELYKCVSFPFRWELEKVVIDDIETADPTIAEINGVWWLFAASRPCEDLIDDNFMELRVFHSKSPLGPWNRLTAYPVKSDVRSSRPAGNLFWWQGALHRPAQDCSTKYGHAISINRITELNTASFCEKEVAKIYPDIIPGSSCVHTVNRCEGLTVLDIMRKVKRL